MYKVVLDTTLSSHDVLLYTPVGCRFSALGTCPCAWNWTMIIDHLTVSRPAQLDRLLGVNASCANVATGSEPVLLRSSGCPCQGASVDGPCDGVAKNLVDKLVILGHNSSCQVVGHPIESIKDGGQLTVLPIDEHLEWTEELGGGDLEV